MTVPQALVGSLGLGHPQKFGNGSEFFGQLLSRKQVSQTIQAVPPAPPPPYYDIIMI